MMEKGRIAPPLENRHRILIISHEVVGTRMAGPGIRYYHLARVLAREFSVTLAAPAGSDLAPHAEFSVLVYRDGQDPALEKAIAEAEAILVPAVWYATLPCLQQTTAAVIIDGYDPFLAETLALQAEMHSQLVTLTQASLAGDFFICASERQRDWWLGVLEASGRINALTYGEDPSLRRLVDLVPFGLSDTPPQQTHRVVKGVWPGINEHDRLILWGGGLWYWLDPLTAIRAVAKIAQARENVKLVFPGARHPNPGMSVMPTHIEAARALAEQLGVLERFVFFGDWIPYEDWCNVLLESDIALTLHEKQTLETRLAFRSRVLDYIWAGLPTVATRGDVTSELIAECGIGAVVDCQDVDGVAQSILQLLDTPRVTFSDRFARARRSLTWEKAAQPLIDFCRHPRLAPDRVALGVQLGTAPYRREITQLQAEVNQLRTLVNAYNHRLFVRLADRIHRLVERH